MHGVTITIASYGHLTFLQYDLTVVLPLDVSMSLSFTSVTILPGEANGAGYVDAVLT